VQIGLNNTTWVMTGLLVVVMAVQFALDPGVYWLAVLFTFALGTAAGDLVAEKFGLGYLASALIVGAIICAVAALHYGASLNGVLAFWIAYILTRPLGASLGDLLSQDRDAGGLGVGATTTSVIFGVIIVALVTYLSWTKVDRIPTDATEFAPDDLLEEPATEGSR